MRKQNPSLGLSLDLCGAALQLGYDCYTSFLLKSRNFDLIILHHGHVPLRHVGL